MTPLNVQFVTMMAMVGGGFQLGMALDTYRRLCRNRKRPVWLLFTTEILFWLLETVILFGILFAANSGEIRLYIFAACLLGFAAYQVLGKKWYRALLEVFIHIGTALGRFGANSIRLLVIMPVKGLFAILAAVLLFLVQIVMAIVLFILKIACLPFRWIGAAVWHFMPKSAKNFVHKCVGVYSTMKESCSKLLKWIKFKRR